MAQLGITVTSNADKADAGLKRLVATSDVAEKAVKRLGAANQNLGAGYDRLQKQADAAAAMLQRIDRMAGVTGGVKRAAADIEAYGTELDRLRAKYNPAFAASQAYGRELEGINYAHRVGAISAVEQASAIASLDARYRSATVSAENYRAASTRAQRGSGATNANALNLGFQAQDIAMMTLMGQAPGMLALQQGMQVGGIFSQMGSGKAIVQGLGSAVAMLLNPLNLATIAAIGLGAAGVQAFMGMVGGADDASASLETHEEWLGKILTGYTEAKNAVDAVFESASKLPQGVVLSDLNASLRDQEKARKDLDARISQNNAGLAETINFLHQIEAIGRSGGEDAGALSLASKQIEAMRQLGVDTNSTRAELEAAATASKEFFNSTQDDALKDLANDANKLVMELIGIQHEAKATDAALNAIDRDIQINIRMNQSFGNAMDGLNALYQDPRSKFDQDRAQAKSNAEWATNTATSYGQAVAAAENYERVLGSIDAAEAKANEKANARAAKAAEKPIDKWQTASDNFLRGIDQQLLEISLYGQSTFEIARQRAEFDLLTSAKQAGIDVNAQLANSDMTVAESIAQMAQQSAEATVEMERLADTYNFGRNVFSSFFGDLKTGIEDGKGLWQSLGDAALNALDRIASKALEMAANGIFDMLFKGVMGGMGGGYGSLGNSIGAGAGSFSNFRSLMSFDGGGYTGAGSRLGGMDGKGGFLAMMHPDETVVDHTRTANNNFASGNDNRSSETTVRLIMPDGWRAEVVNEARAGAREDSVRIVQQNQRDRNDYWAVGGNPR